MAERSAFSSSTSSLSPSTAFSTSIPEPRLASVHGEELCYPIPSGTNHINIILFHYNFTGRMQNRRPQEDKMTVLKMVIIAASCLIVLENLVVLVAIIRKVRAHRWVYSCLASITLSDLLAGVAYLTNLCLSGSRTFQLSPKMWFLREGVLFVVLAASTFSLLVTAIERYSAMVRPIAENETSKTIRLRGLILFCWGLAILIGLLPLLGWNCICKVPTCSTLLPLYAKNYILFCVVMFSIILVGVVGLYASIYCWVQKSAKQAVSRCGRKRSMRLLKTVLLILFTFLICWIPLFVFLLIDIFWVNKTWALHKAFGWILTLAVTNSLLNPIIYSLGSKEVRRAVVELLCCCCIWAGLPGPRNCLIASDVHLGSSTGTQSSLKMRESFRSSMVLNRRLREPLSSNSSMMSNDTSGLQHTLD
ncbi:sphingosine 1-phosphate receptor 4 [Rhineura floridana]|uniref:sphingosine 1-phosphate receptor 4 n=1 Tax=Rhineura floridana TaxID=261503 RepID=UPI002AC8319A|nr:sphingosine 1-phosphate receptor 4 [Rhineura floridana]